MQMFLRRAQRATKVKLADDLSGAGRVSRAICTPHRDIEPGWTVIVRLGEKRLVHYFFEVRSHEEV
jgi:hypothetical protein